MRKFALIFVLAVFLPSVVLGWLALDSLRNQGFVFERQQELLLQGTSDTLAERIRGILGAKLNEFGNQVDQLASGTDVVAFDERIREIWPAATVGFVVTLNGKLVAPSAKGNGPARRFLEANSRFLTNAESAEVYQQPSQPAPRPVAANSEPEPQRSAKNELAKSSPGKPQPKDEGAEPAQQKAKAFEPIDSTAKVPGGAPPLSVAEFTADDSAIRQSSERIKTKRYLDFECFARRSGVPSINRGCDVRERRPFCRERSIRDLLASDHR